MYVLCGLHRDGVGFEFVGTCGFRFNTFSSLIFLDQWAASNKWVQAKVLMRLHCGRSAGLEVAQPFDILDLNGDCDKKRGDIRHVLQLIPAHSEFHNFQLCFGMAMKIHFQLGHLLVPPQPVLLISQQDGVIEEEEFLAILGQQLKACRQQQLEQKQRRQLQAAVTAVSKSWSVATARALAASQHGCLGSSNDPRCWIVNG